MGNWKDEWKEFSITGKVLLICIYLVWLCGVIYAVNLFWLDLFGPAEKFF